MSVFLIFLLVPMLQDGVQAGSTHGYKCEDYNRSLNTAVEITTSYNVGSIVHTISDADLLPGDEVDVILKDDSQFFILEHYSEQDVWEVKVKQCLPAGLQETLKCILRGDIISCLFVLRINVSSAGPDYGLDEAVNIPLYKVASCDINSLPAVFTPVTYSNCVSFSCSITSATPENIFMVKNGHDVHLVEMPSPFLTIYYLEINCVEIVDLITQSHVSVQEAGVAFVNDLSCLSTYQIQTPSTASSSPVSLAHKSTIVKQSTQFSVNVSQISTYKLSQASTVKSKFPDTSSYATSFTIDVSTSEITGQNITVPTNGNILANGTTHLQTANTGSTTDEQSTSSIRFTTPTQVFSAVTSVQSSPVSPDIKLASYSADFCSDPAKVAAMATVTGILILINSVLGVYFVVCRRIGKSQTRRVRDEEIAEENNPT